MLNRHLQVKVVKDDQKSAPTEEEITKAVKVITRTVSHELHNLGKKALGGVLLYVAADTARKMLIAKASK